jgi:nicotinate-nucleotide pyrophosphorylase (carboxylating)
MDLDLFIKYALEEDMPQGDKTTMSTISENSISKCFLIAKEDGILSGVDVFKRVFYIVDKNVEVNFLKNKGEEIKNKEVIANIKGNTRSILMAERVSLNLLQHLSGIATITKEYTKRAKHALILDTRKTTPLLRALEKKAVKDGGGVNHRMNLSDMIMIKDNHIEASGSITKACLNAKNMYPDLKIEVEAETMDEFKECLDSCADIIMLDNMSNELMEECVKLNNHKKLLEASGNMSLERIEGVDKTGVDFISVGKLTHSVKALDISLKFHKI